MPHSPHSVYRDDVLFPLSALSVGQKGIIRRIGHPASEESQDMAVEERLLEVGFEEGAEIQILHRGPIGKDPIAVRVDRTMIALRRSEADTIFVEV